MTEQGEHRVTVWQRARVEVSGIEHVDTYNETRVVVRTKMGGLVIEGEELSIASLDLQQGTLVIAGTVKGLIYTDQENRTRGLVKRLLR